MNISTLLSFNCVHMSKYFKTILVPLVLVLVCASSGYAQPIVITETVNDASTNGGSDGSITLSVSGGVAPYTYAWDHGPTTQDVSGLSAGNYGVTVTDANSTTADEDYVVGEPALLNVSANVIPESGPAMVDGSINLNVTGGVAPYTYSWDHGPTTQNVNGLSAGTYWVTVTDMNSENVYTSFTVTQSVPGLSVTANITPESGPAMMDGAISLMVSGGSAPYSYSWDYDAGQTTSYVGGLSAGTYWVTVTDMNGDDVYTSFTVTENSSILTVVENITDESGPAMADGSITLSVSGGSAPYSYQWDHGPTTRDVNGLSMGTYGVTITDMMSEQTYKSYMVHSSSSGLSVTANITPESGPAMMDGAISLMVSGGMSPYSYSWDYDAGQTTSYVGGLSAGTYWVTVTDMNGDDVYTSFTVTENSSMLTVVENITNESGPAMADGSITLSVSGGSAPYSYQWDHGPTTRDLSGLAPGVYNVTITDMVGEQTYKTYYIYTDSPDLSVTANITPESGPAMMDGAISLMVSGGSAPYSYSWDYDAGQTTSYVGGLSAGTYWVTVTDMNGDNVYQSFTVTESSTMLTVIENITNESPAMYDGAITLSVSGGSAPYSYQWDHGPTTRDVSGLMSGTYGVTITDMMSESVYRSYYVAASNQGLTISESITSESGPAMMDGAISLMVSGGSAPYNFVWDHGPTTQAVSGLSSGSYGVTVTDMTSNSQYMNYFVPQSGPLNVSLTSNYYTCIGNGRIMLNISGGTPPYNMTAQNPGGDIEYFWMDGAQWVTDIYQTGLYEVTVTDMDGTQLVETIDVMDSPELSIALSSPYNSGSYNVSCSGTEGVIDITISGGVPPFNIYVTGESEMANVEATAAAAVVHSAPMTFTTSESTFQLTGLAADRYYVNVTDVSTCGGGMEEIELTKPSIDLQVSPTVYPNGYYFSCADCDDGLVTPEVLGGTGPYSYSWFAPPTEVMDMDMRIEGASLFSTDEFLDDQDWDLTDPEAQQFLVSNDMDLTGASPEQPYLVYVEDQNGCSSVQLFLLERPKDTQGVSSNLTSCEGFGSESLGQWIRDTAKVHVCPEVQVGIGTDVIPEGYALGVAGKIMAEEVEVRLAVNWPDYVFKDDYNRASLEDVNAFIKENGHLPDVPSAEEIERNGVSLGEMDAILLRKIEELTLYLIELKGENEELRKTIEELNH